MKNAKLYLLPLMVLLISNCQTPQEYFGRPNLVQCINNGDGTMFCNGKSYSSTNAICAKPEEFDTAFDYYDDKEYRLYICLKHPSRCR